MRSFPGHPTVLSVAALAAASVLSGALAGCSTRQQTAPRSRASVQAPGSPPGLSPSGVTTSVNAPAGAMEEEFYQACHWAKVWITDQGGDPHAQVEPYLAMIQSSPAGQDGTWRTPWTKLTPQQQAAVIVAATTAADGACD